MSLEAVDTLLLHSDLDANWELSHENSKTSLVELHPLFKIWPSDATIVANMKQLRRVKPYTDFPKLALPREVPAATRGFDEVLFGRQTARGFGAGPIGLAQLAKVLLLSYG